MKRLLTEWRLCYLWWLLVELLLLTNVLHLLLLVLYDWLRISKLGLVRRLELGIQELRWRLREDWLLFISHFYVLRLP